MLIRKICIWVNFFLLCKEHMKQFRTNKVLWHILCICVIVSKHPAFGWDILIFYYWLSFYCLLPELLIPLRCLLLWAAWMVGVFQATGVYLGIFTIFPLDEDSMVIRTSSMEINVCFRISVCQFYSLYQCWFSIALRLHVVCILLCSLRRIGSTGSNQMVCVYPYCLLLLHLL